MQLPLTGSGGHAQTVPGGAGGVGGGGGPASTNICTLADRSSYPTGTVYVTDMLATPFGAGRLTCPEEVKVTGGRPASLGYSEMDMLMPGCILSTAWGGGG